MPTAPVHPTDPHVAPHGANGDGLPPASPGEALTDLGRTITDNATAALFMMDTQGRCTFMNPAAEAMTGYTLDEIRDMPLHNAIHHHRPDGRPYPLHECPIDRALPEKNQVRAHEDVFIRKDGTFFPVVCAAEPILKDGVPVGTVVEVRDVTREKAAQEELRRNEERLRFSLEAGSLGAWEWDVRTGVVSWSETLERIHGLEPGTFPGTFEAYQSDIYPEDREYVLSTISRSVEDGEPHRLEYRIIRPDGAIRWLLARGQLFRDEQGAPLRLSGVCMDITDRKRAEEALRFLAEASNVLASDLEYERTIAAVVRLAVPHLADWCAVDLLTEEGTVRRLAVAHVDPEKIALAYELDRRYPPDPSATFGVPSVLRTGKAEFYPELPDFILEGTARDEEHLRVIRELGLRSAIIAPLEARGRIFGTFTFIAAESGRIYTPDDLSLVQDLARRAAVAIDNARLFQERRQAEERLTEEAHILETIHRVSNALGAELDLEKVVQTATDAATELCGAQFGAFFYNVLDDRGEAYTLYTISGVPREEFSKFPMPRNTKVFEPTFRGEGVVRLDDVTRDQRYAQNPPYHGMPEGHLPVRSYLAVPVISRSGEVIGGLFFGHEAAGAFTERAERIVTGIAAQAAVAVDNARLFRQAREAEERARRQFEFTHALTENLGEGVYALDAAGNITFMNPAAEEILGWTAAEAVGKHSHSLFHYKHSDGSPFPVEECPVHASLTRGVTAGRREDEFVRKDGSMVPVSVTIAPLMEGGRVAGAVKAFHDISDRRQADETLRQGAVLAALRAEISEALNRSGELDSTLQHAAQALVDHLGVAFARIWTLNEAEEVLELRASAGLYTHLDGPHGRVPVGQFKIGRIAASRQPHLTNDVANDPNVSDQEWAHREGMQAFAGYPLLIEDRVVGVVAMFSRQTLPEAVLRELAPTADNLAQYIVRKESDAEIRSLNATLEQRVRERTAQLEEANRELEAFSYSVSHDLRAPLRHIGGFAERLQRHAGETLDDSGNRYLRIVIDSARHAGQLVDNLLAFSRMGRAELRRTRVAMTRLAEDTWQGLANEIEGRSVEWVLKPLPEVEGDPDMLRQVWANLLSNAVKYTRSRPEARIEVGAEPGEREVTFYVRDNGVGFDMRYVDKLFGVFQRLHAAEEFEGVGIGLANVRRIVHRHGGRTWAEGTPGEGATVYFSLPCAEGNGTGDGEECRS